MTNTTHIRAAQRVTGRPTIEITCRICRVPYTPSSDDVRSGPETYRCCPDCRTPADADVKPEVRN
jgi:hypothetical protein